MANALSKLQPQFAGGDTPVSLIGFARGGYVSPQMLYRMATIKKEVAQGKMPASGNQKYANKVRQMLAKKQGNMVPGTPPLNPYKDNKLVPMRSGEYVIPQDAVAKIGVDNLDNMVQNALGTVTPPSGSPAMGYARGGYGEWGSPMGARTSEPNFWNRGRTQRMGRWGMPTAASNRQSVEVNGPQGRGPGFPNGGPDMPPPANFHDPFGGRMGEIGDSPHSINWMMSNQFSPPGGLPGSWQGQTLLPTTFDAQGYPYAVPANFVPNFYNPSMTNPTDPTGAWHAGQHINPDT